MRPQSTDDVRYLLDLLQGLTGAPGSRALLRRFGELMRGTFGVQRMDFARVTPRSSPRNPDKVALPKALQATSEAPTQEAQAEKAGAPVHQDGAMPLQRRTLQIEGVLALSEGEWDELVRAWADISHSRQALEEGYLNLDVGGRALCLALVDDPQAQGGCLVIWEQPSAASDPRTRMLIEHVVRQLQNESRWFRKLDTTQALLYRDDLTGLYNTRYLEVALDAELRRADRFQTQFCLLFIDLDGFKPINDHHGHLSGSSVLRQVADVIREAVREVDVPIRYGGDEFVIVLLGATCAKGVLAAERVRRRIEQKEFRLEDGGAARITCSIGVAAYPEHGKDRSTLLRIADETMYDSKRAGKNRVTVYGQTESVT